MDVHFQVHFSVLKVDIWRYITQLMTPKWQQSEEAEAAGRSLSEGKIMSARGPKLFFPEIWPLRETSYVDVPILESVTYNAK